MYPIMYKLEDAGFISSEKRQVSKRMSSASVFKYLDFLRRMNCLPCKASE